MYSHSSACHFKPVTFVEYFVLLSSAGGAREAWGRGSIITSVVGLEAHLLLARPGSLLEWRCHRSAIPASILSAGNCIS